MLSQSANRVNIFSNDPHAKGLTLIQVAPPAGESPFAIPGWTGAGGLFKPGTPEFQAGQLYVVLNRTYAMWADLFGASFPWQPRVPQLPVVPRAGKDFNAYYDRRGLKFFFDDNPATRETVYTCESGDIIAHECGHAVLDAHHPDYWDSLLAETAAFHEAFGDISAMLAALDEPNVRAAILAENDGDLAQSNAVTRLAEQLARGLYDAGLAHAVVSGEALRDAANAFRYCDPEQLPGRAPAAQLSSESHSFSRIFTGAFYDLLIAVYEQLRHADAALSPDAALAQARGIAGQLLAHGLILAPGGDATFKTIATAMFKADAQDFGGKNFGALRKTFVARQVLTEQEADALKTGDGAEPTKPGVLAGTASASVGAPITLGTASARIGVELPSEFRKLPGVLNQAFRLVEELVRGDARRVLRYAVTREMELKGAELGIAQGVVVSLIDALAVTVDSQGDVIASLLHQADRVYERRVRDHVARLVARGRIYATREGETVDPAELIEQKKPYYIAYDEAGKKRIRRAFIACGACRPDRFAKPVRSWRNYNERKAGATDSWVDLDRPGSHLLVDAVFRVWAGAVPASLGLGVPGALRAHAQLRPAHSRLHPRGARSRLDFRTRADAR